MGEVGKPPPARPVEEGVDHALPPAARSAPDVSPAFVTSAGSAPWSGPLTPASSTQRATSSPSAGSRTGCVWSCRPMTPSGASSSSASAPIDQAACRCRCASPPTRVSRRSPTASPAHDTRPSTASVGDTPGSINGGEWTDKRCLLALLPGSHCQTPPTITSTNDRPSSSPTTLSEVRKRHSQRTGKTTLTTTGRSTGITTTSVEGFGQVRIRADPRTIVGTSARYAACPDVPRHGHSRWKDASGRCVRSRVIMVRMVRLVHERTYRSGLGGVRAWMGASDGRCGQLCASVYERHGLVLTRRPLIGYERALRRHHGGSDMETHPIGSAVTQRLRTATSSPPSRATGLRPVRTTGTGSAVADRPTRLRPEAPLRSGFPRGFRRLKSGIPGPLAQLAEQKTFNLLVVGSSPTGPTRNLV